jgi:3-hydroxyisobutyrate dehydrogenase-like beta-hydroxyacid dehydrogenase
LDGDRQAEERTVTPGRVAVLGLGEAGSRLASDLAAAGVDVRGYDPVGTQVAGLSVTADHPASAVAGCDVVLSVNAAKVAFDVAGTVLPALASGAVYADLNTTAPSLQRELAGLAGASGVRYADVALLRPVLHGGLLTPALASGTGAQRFADLFGPLGMPVTVVSREAGDAAALKLLRSVFMKGLAASVVESVRAAEASAHADWLRAEIADVIGEPLLERLLEGSRTHAARRADEMEAASDLLRELGVEPHVASASASLLAGLAEADQAGVKVGPR